MNTIRIRKKLDSATLPELEPLIGKTVQITVEEQATEAAPAGRTLADFDAIVPTDEDLEGFIDFLKFLREAKVVFFMIEQPQDNHVRVSFRSKDRYDMNKIAVHFKGGGHKKASGCIVRGGLEEVEKMILEHLHREFPFS